MTSLTDLSVQDLRLGLDKGEFTSVEITEALLISIERAQTLNAYIDVPQEKVLTAAKNADAARRQGTPQGLLAGIPVAVKDNISTKGIRTSCASKMLATYIPPYDATVVQKLHAAGGFTLGKTSLDEFAMGSSNETSFFGPVRNPWDITKVPGGTSGGSAVAVAARLAPIALGTDTGGSVRQPASFCGVVGLKPTYGRVSRYGVVAFASSLDQVGIVSRTVEDCALTLEALAGFDSHDATSSKREIPSYSGALGHGVKGLRIGIPKEYFVEGLDPEVKNLVERSIRDLEQEGATIVEISLPHTEAALAVYYIIAPAEASSNLSRYDGIRYGFRAEGGESLKEVYLKTRSEGFGSEVKRRILIGTYVLSSGFYDAYYKKAQQVRTIIVKDFADAFADKCDVIATPVAPTPAFALGEKSSNPLEMYLSDIYTIPTSLAGLPGISVPCGFTKSKLPVGIQFIGKHFDEQTILTVGAVLQQKHEWHLQKPEQSWISRQS